MSASSCSTLISHTRASVACAPCTPLLSSGARRAHTPCLLGSRTSRLVMQHAARSAVRAGRPLQRWIRARASAHAWHRALWRMWSRFGRPRARRAVAARAPSRRARVLPRGRSQRACWRRGCSLRRWPRRPPRSSASPPTRAPRAPPPRARRCAHAATARRRACWGKCSLGLRRLVAPRQARRPPTSCSTAGTRRRRSWTRCCARGATARWGPPQGSLRPRAEREKRCGTPQARPTRAALSCCAAPQRSCAAPLSSQRGVMRSVLGARRG